MEFKSKKINNLYNVITKENITFVELKNASLNLSRAHVYDEADAEVEYLIEFIGNLMWSNFRRSAKKLFKSYNSDVRATLEGVLSRIGAEFQLSNNFVGSHVKIGGDMISGKAPLDIYISYKNSSGEGCSFGAYQNSLVSPIKWQVKRYCTRFKNKFKFVKDYAYDDLSAASDDYMIHMSSVYEEI